IALANGDPTMPTHRLYQLRVGLLEPRNHGRCLCFEHMKLWVVLIVVQIIVRQRAVERILAWDEINWDVVASLRAIGIVHSTVILQPPWIPDTALVLFFTNPKNGRHDVHFPRVTLRS